MRMWPRITWAIHITRAVILLGSTACSPIIDRTERLLPKEQSSIAVMSYNLDGFAYADRNQDGQADDFKPEAEIEAIVSIIARNNPDILALQEIGSSNAMAMLQTRLAGQGCAFSDADFLMPPDGSPGLGILSKRSITSRDPITNAHYTIQNQSYPASRGFQQVDIAAAGGKTVRIINVHLKSKEFHPAGQTEMRRNEARLLAAHIRSRRSDTNITSIIACGDFGDGPASATLRSLIGEPSKGLIMLNLADPQGDAWTSLDRTQSTWSRQHYFLIDPESAQFVDYKKSGVLGGVEINLASRHRPLYFTFTVRE